MEELMFVEPYPLPRIDLLVDSIAGCEILSMMDIFQGYYQIAMAEEDRDKTAFVILREIFCFLVMPLGLKNAGATYQRLVNLIFEDEIGESMEFYVDDIIGKSKKEVDHFDHLKKISAFYESIG